MQKSGILFNIFLYLRDKFDPKPIVSEEVITCKEIVLKLLDYPKTEVVFIPVSHKRFIINKEKEISVTIENRTIHIINHVYSYILYIEDEKSYQSIIDKFNFVSEKKKTELEEKITTNIKHSLIRILENLN
jgi:hypothetical protein